MSMKFLLQFKHTIKISLQLDHRSCTYELFQLIIEKYRSKTTSKILYKTIPYYMLTV